MSLENDFKYYLANQDALVGQHKGKFVVIKDAQVIGVFDSEISAVETTSKKHELGTFLVQKCEPGAESYSQTFHSRVWAVAC